MMTAEQLWLMQQDSVDDVDRCHDEALHQGCQGCQFDQFVDADQSFDGGEWSGSFDYGDSPEHTCPARCELCDNVAVLVVEGHDVCEVHAC